MAASVPDWCFSPGMLRSHHLQLTHSSQSQLTQGSQSTIIAIGLWLFSLIDIACSISKSFSSPPSPAEYLILEQEKKVKVTQLRTWLGPAALLSSSGYLHSTPKSPSKTVRRFSQNFLSSSAWKNAESPHDVKGKVLKRDRYNQSCEFAK